MRGRLHSAVDAGLTCNTILRGLAQIDSCSHLLELFDVCFAEVPRALLGAVLLGGLAHTAPLSVVWCEHSQHQVVWVGVVIPSDALRQRPECLGNEVYTW